MYCDKCGAYVRDGGKFCPKCGSPVNNAPKEDLTYAPVIPPVPAQEKPKKKRKKGWIKALISIIVIIAILGVGGYIAYDFEGYRLTLYAREYAIKHQNVKIAKFLYTENDIKNINKFIKGDPRYEDLDDFTVQTLERELKYISNKCGYNYDTKYEVVGVNRYKKSELKKLRSDLKKDGEEDFYNAFEKPLKKADGYILSEIIGTYSGEEGENEDDLAYLFVKENGIWKVFWIYSMTPEVQENNEEATAEDTTDDAE